MKRYKGIETAYGVPVNRAIASLYPEGQRIYFDPFSEKILSGFGKWFVKLLHFPRFHRFMTKYWERKFPGMLGYFFCRFRYYDDVIKECLEKNEIEVIVNLGAGMDCKAYYLPGMENLHYFEIDHPSVLKKKIEKLKKILGKLPEHVTYLGVDFNTQSFEDVLEKGGFNLSSKTLFILESVSAYLTKEANDNILKYVSRSGSGSKLVFSYVTKDFMNGKNLHHKTARILHERIMVKKELTLLHGYDQSTIEEYLSRFSLTTLEHLGANKLKERYIKPTNVDLDIVEVERLVLAKVE